MNSQRRTCKRSLKEVLGTGVLEGVQHPKLVTVVFDVLSTTGDRFGLAMHDMHGRPIYVDPVALQGVEVVYPMKLCATPNSRCLAASMSVALAGELSR